MLSWYGRVLKRRQYLGEKNVWSMKCRVPDKEVNKRGLGERLYKKTVMVNNGIGTMLFLLS